MLRLFFDHNVPAVVSQLLRERHLDVLTAFEDGSHQLPDDRLLERATKLGRVLVSHDWHLVREATRCQRQDLPFGGVIYCHQNRLPLAELVNELELVVRGSAADELNGCVVFLPL